MKLNIDVSRNPESRNTLLHKPIVQLNDDIPQSRGCWTCELLDYLRGAGVSEEDVNRVQREIEEQGHSVLRSNQIVDTDLERVLEPEEDLGKVLLREARQQFGQ